MSLWNKIFGKPNDPFGAAAPYMNQAIGTQNPYVAQGQQANDFLNPLYASMGGDPTGYLDKLMQNYEPSKGYQLKRDEALRAAGNSAAAGGMRGTQQDLVNSTQIADRLLGDDMQQWLNNVYGIQGMGLGGQQRIADRGFDASTNLANLYGQQGQLAFKGEDWKNRQKQDLTNQFLHLLSTGGGALAGGFMGSAAGGVGALPGAMYGAQVGGQLF